MPDRRAANEKHTTAVAMNCGRKWVNSGAGGELTNRAIGEWRNAEELPTARAIGNKQQRAPIGREGALQEISGVTDGRCSRHLQHFNPRYTVVMPQQFRWRLRSFAHRFLLSQVLLSQEDHMLPWQRVEHLLNLKPLRFWIFRTAHQQWCNQCADKKASDSFTVHPGRGSNANIVNF